MLNCLQITRKLINVSILSVEDSAMCTSLLHSYSIVSLNHSSNFFMFLCHPVRCLPFGSGLKIV